MELQSFISWLLSLESYSLLNIIYVNTSQDIEVLSNTTDVPRMILSVLPDWDDSDFWGPYYEEQTVAYQKFHFGSNIFSIIILSSQFEFNDSLSFLTVLDYQVDSKLLLIFDDIIDPHVPALFLQQQFLNLIFVSAHFFEESQIFYVCEIFPTAQYIEKRFQYSADSPYKDHMKNLHGSQVSAACPKDIPNCMYPDGGSQTSGLMHNILKDFETFINCNLTIHSETKAIVDFSSLDTDDDIYAMTIFLPYLSPTVSFIIFQSTSYPLERLHIFLVVPSPKPIHLSLYPFKPFSLDLWISVACVILYSTVLIKLSTPKNSLEAGDYFTRILRIALGQTITFRHNHPVISLFYMLMILFGFIINTWYGAILGSYMSTFLNESPITSFEEIRTKDLQIISPNISSHTLIFETVPEFFEHKDMFKVMTFEEASELLNSMDNRFAYSENSNHWNYFIVPQMNYYNDPKLQRFKINFGTSFLSIIFPGQSFYKKPFDRLIFLLKDVGLYKHYTESVFIDNLKYNFVNYPYVPPRDKVQVIRLKYFYYVFFGWFFGLGIGLLVFVVEVLWSCKLLRNIVRT